MKLTKTPGEKMNCLDYFLISFGALFFVCFIEIMGASMAQTSSYTIEIILNIGEGVKTIMRGL